MLKYPSVRTILKPKTTHVARHQVKSRLSARRSSCFPSAAMLCLWMAAPAQAIDPPFQADQTPPASSATETPPIRTHVRLDPKHPPKIGSDFYPPLSVKNGEQGTCYVGLFVDTDGSVPAMQLVKSTGYGGLDGACFEAFKGVSLIPATLNGKPVAGWVVLPIGWALHNAGQVRYPPLPDFSTPRLPADYELSVGSKYYPESSRARHEEGACIIEASVGSDGSVNSTKTLKATGFNDLDRACVNAISQAKFIPEKQDGHPVPDSTYIAIYWHLR
jgi:TonB family protein